MRSRFPNDVVISLSSSCPTANHSFSARSNPTSSHVSLIAVYRSSSSSASCRPPGNAMCPLHCTQSISLSHAKDWNVIQRPTLSVALDARLMNRISAVVPSSFTQG